uniref:Toll-like receptor 23b n=1 Tax=Boleophthalmus pectinirostris TaxID=150288 RepID=A0A482IDY5_BOLPE|nr:toll-like receptor 23b [Boleophthalmus pectinirostris]
MDPHTSPLVSFLFVLLLPRPSRLFSLRSCSLDPEDLRQVSCDGRNLLTEMPSDVPTSAVSLSVRNFNLTRLGLNHLSGLDKLRTLNLGRNQISSVEPGAFLHSPALKHLSLDWNELTNLTDDMFRGLSDLTYLHLGGNLIQFISKDAFAPLMNLQELHLPKNNLTEIGDFAIALSSCPMLRVLFLGENSLTSFESKNFPFPLNVTDLDLNSNPLREFTLHHDIFPRLKSLNVSVNPSDVQWDVSDSSFLQNLKIINLSATNFTIETYKLIFRSVNSLEMLDLSVGTLSGRGLLDFACAVPSLRKLDLSVNDIFFLNGSLLRPCPDVTDLDLSSNGMKNLSESSLRMLTRLSRLNLTMNFLSQVPTAVRNISTLKFLLLSSNFIEQLRCSDFAGLSQLTELVLSNNRLFELNNCVFEDLWSLQKLYIDRNFLYTFENSFNDPLQNLLVLDAEDNIEILNRGVFNILSHLRELTVGKGTITNDGVFDGLTDLRYLSYNLGFLSTETSAASGGRSLSSLFTDLPSLRTLVITFSYKLCVVLPRDFLRGLDSLTSFSSTRFFCKPHPEMFLYTPHLLNLEITNNDQWENPDPTLFKPIGDLEKLDLSRNRLKSLDVISGANLTKLKELVLADNELKIIDEDVLESLPSLEYLDLSGNLFVCNCSNAGFVQWVLRKRRVYVAGAFQYRCAYPLSHQGELLLNFNVQSCWESVSLICFVTSSSLVVVTLLSSFVYHFLRWQLVYGYFLFRALLYERRKKNEGREHVYDAFVSYNVHDEEWVYRQLVPELEERQGWKLCLHHRDFEPGREIMENITDAIYSSRKTLCVISAQYLQSEWCSREIQMASFRLFDEQKDVLILLFLEEFSSDQLSPFYRMRKLVRSRTYLSWTQNHGALFWERVRQALQSGNEPTDPHHPLTTHI